MSEQTSTTTTSTSDQQAADLKAERERQAKTPTKAEREYLASGTAATPTIKPTTFAGDEQPPGGHPQDPTSKTSVGSSKTL